MAGVDGKRGSRRQRLSWLISGLIALAITLAGNTLWVNSKTRPAAPRDGGSIIDTSVVPANVKVEGAGPPIVLIHGFGAAIDWWDEIAPTLAQKHRVIRIDLIGHGGTEAPSTGYSIERQAALVSSVLDKLEVDRTTVIGHSMGGEVATALAEINPHRIERLILIDTPPSPGTTFSLLMKAYLEPVLGELLSRVQIDAMIRNGLAQGFMPGFAVPEKFIADIKQLTYTSFRSAHDDSVTYRTAKPTYERIAELTPVPPLLVIFGARDAIVPPDHASFLSACPEQKS
jgi:pimeloyl-ACP methyl ester carboxylesterase